MESMSKHNMQIGGGLYRHNCMHLCTSQTQKIFLSGLAPKSSHRERFLVNVDFHITSWSFHSKIRWSIFFNRCLNIDVHGWKWETIFVICCLPLTFSTALSRTLDFLREQGEMGFSHLQRRKLFPFYVEVPFYSAPFWIFVDDGILYVNFIIWFSLQNFFGFLLSIYVLIVCLFAKLVKHWTFNLILQYQDNGFH